VRWMSGSGGARGGQIKRGGVVKRLSVGTGKLSEVVKG
jgi:hypothetical protein